MKRINQMEPWIGKEEDRAILSVLHSGWITEATKTKEFENEIAHYNVIKYFLKVQTTIEEIITEVKNILT